MRCCFCCFRRLPAASIRTHMLAPQSRPPSKVFLNLSLSEPSHSLPWPSFSSLATKVEEPRHEGLHSRCHHSLASTPLPPPLLPFQRRQVEEPRHEGLDGGAVPAAAGQRGAAAAGGGAPAAPARAGGHKGGGGGGGTRSRPARPRFCGRQQVFRPTARGIASSCAGAQRPAACHTPSPSPSSPPPHPPQVIRKERAVGVVPTSTTIYEVLEELAITVQVCARACAFRLWWLSLSARVGLPSSLC